MPCFVDVGSITGTLSWIVITSPPDLLPLIFWNTGVVLFTPTVIPARSMVRSR
jgi:hypothetical protein